MALPCAKHRARGDEIRWPYLVRDIEREEMAVIEVVDGGDESWPDLELVLRHEGGGIGIVVMTTHLLHPKHLHQLTEEDVEHLGDESSGRM